MDVYTLPWAFYMKYNHRSKEMTLYLSNDFKERMELSLTKMTLQKNDIEEFVHRYDYRKLSYFSKMKLNEPFDTIMRFKMSHGKSYLKTHAICQVDQSGFHCLNIEDIYLFKINQKMRTSELFFKNLIFDIEGLESIIEIDANKNINQIKLQLSNLVQRTSI